MVAVASLAVGALFEEPAELLAAESERDGDGDDGRTAAVSVGKRLAPAAGARKKRLQQGFANRLRALLLSQPVAVRALLLLPLWCVGRAGIAGLALLLRALAPVWQMVLGVLLNALLLIGLFALVYKLLFPNRSLKALLKKKNWIALACASVVLSVADALLRRHWPDYAPVSIGIRLGLGFLVLALLCRRMLGNAHNRRKEIPCGDCNC